MDIPAEAPGTSPVSQGLAAVWEEPIGPLGVRIRERARTPAPAGFVTVSMRAAAINHLDLWLAHGAERAEPPRVICADGAGVVERGAGGWEAGQEVVVYPVVACGRCDECRAGRQVLCRGFGIVGEHTDGTACQTLHLPPGNLRLKPPSLGWEEAAALPLTFLTAWRMLRTKARLESGQSLLVVGAGAGVAVAAIAIGRHLGARVLATSRSAAKRARAVEIGAEAAFESSGFSKAIREATGGRGVDVVFEHVGPATLEESFRSLAPGGRIVTCGSTSGPRAEIAMPRLFLRQAELLGSTMGNGGEFDAVLAAVEDGLRPVVSASYELAEVQAALEHLDRAQQFGKVVLRIPS
ncbi:MAG: zinc-binding dehydrogenase [Candidatus Dormibacteraceae bacterium]